MKPDYRQMTRSEWIEFKVGLAKAILAGNIIGGLIGVGLFAIIDYLFVI